MTCGLLNKFYTPPWTVSKQDKVALLKKYGARLKPLKYDMLYFVDVVPAVAPIYDELIAKAIEKREHF